jgi:hypothetical protein
MRQLVDERLLYEGYAGGALHASTAPIRRVWLAFRLSSDSVHFNPSNYRQRDRRPR